MEMTLQEVKQVIKIVSANEKLNNKVSKDLQKDDDCFGKEYLETNEECVICQVLAEVGDRRAPLSVFCKELIVKVEPSTPEVSEEDKKVLADIKAEEPVAKSKKIQKTKLEVGPGGVEALVNRLLEDKVPDESIKKTVYDLYIQAGRDEKYSKVKAGMWVSYTKGRRKKGIFVTGN